MDDFFISFMILGGISFIFWLVSESLSDEKSEEISLGDFDRICENSNIRFSSFEERYDEYEKYCSQINENKAFFKAVEYWNSKMPELNSKYGRNVDGLSMLLAYRTVNDNEEPLDFTKSEEDIDRQIEERIKKAYFLAVE